MLKSHRLNYSFGRLSTISVCLCLFKIENRWHVWNSTSNFVYPRRESCLTDELYNIWLKRSGVEVCSIDHLKFYSFIPCSRPHLKRFSDFLIAIMMDWVQKDTSDVWILFLFGDRGPLFSFLQLTPRSTNRSHFGPYIWFLLSEYVSSAVTWWVLAFISFTLLFATQGYLSIIW